MELYKKHRPKTLDEIFGHKQIVESLRKFLTTKTLPHAILFAGSSGVGKTTLARILRQELRCGDSDYQEINVADNRDIDTIRDISRKMNLSPITGKCRVWLLDEIQSLPKIPQRTLLKMLEDTPRHVYFFLATTEPNQLLKELRNRCTEFSLGKLSTGEIHQLLSKTAKTEGISLSEDVRDRITETADGSARKALVLLNKIITIKKEQDQLEAIHSLDVERHAIDLCRILCKPRTTWAEVRAILGQLEQDPEEVRRAVLGYASKILCNKDDPKAYLILTAFESNFYDSGKAGLVRACYEVVSNK